MLAWDSISFLKPRSLKTSRFPLTPDPVQSDLAEDPNPVPVGGDEEVGNHLPRKFLLPRLEMESEEVQEPGEEILGSSPGEILDVRVLSQFQLPGVEVVDDAGKALLANILNEDLTAQDLLHGGEYAGPEHLRPGAENGLVNTEVLGVTPDGEVGGGVILQDSFPQG